MEISTAKDVFEAGENITLKVSLFDEQSNPVDDDVSITMSDAEGKTKIETVVPSNEFVGIDLKGASYGQGTIVAKYKDSKTTGSFAIKIEELAKFELKGDELIITNIGNTRYTKTIQIMIGETTGIKEPKLDIGEKVSYRLVAPDGAYDIKVSDGRTTLVKNGVVLSGTGKTIGAIDTTPSERSPITGGIRPDDENGNSGSFLSYTLQNSKFIYTFILVIFGIMILIAMKRTYGKKEINKQSKKIGWLNLKLIKVLN